MRDETIRKHQLAEFARWCIEQCFMGHDLDGGDVQAKAAQLGLLTETKYDPAIHGENDYADPGAQWFVFARGLEP